MAQPIKDKFTLALAQLNAVVGDIERNVKRAREVRARAAEVSGSAPAATAPSSLRGTRRKSDHGERQGSHGHHQSRKLAHTYLLERSERRSSSAETRRQGWGAPHLQTDL